MFWELIATVFAGLGAAGIALALRFMTARRLPRWAIPMAAGGAMLGFQIYSEYTWFSHQRSLLPNDVTVVKQIHETAAWRPWTFIVPQTVRFIAVRVGKGAVNSINSQIVLADVYLFERRRLAKHVPQVFHCGQHARADFNDQLQTPQPGAPLDDHWLVLPQDDPLLQVVCQRALAQG